MSSGRFEEKNRTEVPGLIGAEWWQEGVVKSQTDISRRKALLNVLYGGALAIGGVIALRACTGPSEDRDDRPALDVQKKASWSFGANAEALAFTDVVEASVPRAEILGLATRLAPRRADLQPFYGPALFQAIEGPPPGATDPSAPPPARDLADVMVAIETAAMKEAFRLGAALAATVPKAGLPPAYVVDLPGPQAVAFAAGAADALDPVFRFDNWPHPRGVVPAHLTLAAALRYRKLFEARSSARRPPLFVLDRSRLTPYADETKQFDNRYTAQLPSLAQLLALQTSKVFYVSTDGTDADDLNASLVELEKGYDPTRLVSLADLRAAKPLAMLTDPSHATDPEWSARRPVLRQTPYSTATGQRTVPPSFGLVPVILVGGILAGPMFARDSWNRSYGSSGS